MQQLTPGRQIGAAGPAAAVKAVAAKKAAPAHKAAPVQQAARRETGAYSGALNNLSDQQARVQAVGARRQADADKYAAYVMGQQGAIAAAAHKQDQQTLGLDMAVQKATLDSQLKIGGQLTAQRAAAGGTGPVPLQQFSGLVDDQQRSQALLGAVTQQQADKTNTNAGKAGFLQAAAQAGLLANKRAIAGDQYNQESDIGRQRTDVLMRRTESAQADKRASASAAASAASAQLAHEDRMAALSQSAANADANRANSNAQLGARLDAQATQGRANRRVRLKTAATGAAAMGYVTPAEQKRRNTQVKATKTQVSSAQRTVDQNRAAAKALGQKYTPEAARYDLEQALGKNAPQEVVDYALAHGFGRKAGVTKKGQPSAAARFTKYLNDINSGKIAK